MKLRLEMMFSRCVNHGPDKHATDSPFWRHTCYLCLAFGLLCCLVNGRLNALFRANLQTAEAQLFARHFGLGMLMVAYFCHATLAAGHITAELTHALTVYHGLVLCAFAYEFSLQRVWRSSPIFAQAAAGAGVLLHAIVFLEGMHESGALAAVPQLWHSHVDPNEPDWLRSAALECSWEVRALIGIASAASFGVIYDPLGRYLLRHRRSINSGSPRVPRYWMYVLGSLVQIAAWIAASTRFLPTLPNVRYRTAEVSLLNTVPAILLCMLVAEMGFYWSHRLFHTRLLYRHFHVLHHAIEAPSSAYDALYQDPVELETNLLFTYLPLTFVPIHIGAVAFYLYFSGFVAFVLNHSGRDASVTIPLPFTSAGSVTLWSASLHDDHHYFRRGNYGAQFWLFDSLFGTRIHKRKPKTVGQRRWAALSAVLRWTLGTTAQQELADVEELFPRMSPTIARVKHWLSEDTDDLDDDHLLSGEYSIVRGAAHDQ